MFSALVLAILFPLSRIASPDSHSRALAFWFVPAKHILDWTGTFLRSEDVFLKDPCHSYIQYYALIIEFWKGHHSLLRSFLISRAKFSNASLVVSLRIVPLMESCWLFENLLLLLLILLWCWLSLGLIVYLDIRLASRSPKSFPVSWCWIPLALVLGLEDFLFFFKIWEELGFPNCCSVSHSWFRTISLTIASS